MSLFENFLAFYKLDEADGDNRLDFFGLGPPLTPQSTAKKVVGHVGSGVGCGGFGGSNATGYLADDVSNSAFFDIQGVSRTYFGWFKAASFAGDPGIISNWANPGGGVQWLLFKNGGNMQFQIRDGSSVDHAVTLPAPALNVDTFFAFWYDSFTGEIGLRINKNHSSSGNTPSVLTVTSRFAVGSRNGAGAVLNGMVDALGVVNGVQSSGFLDQMFNLGAGIEPPLDANPGYIGGYMLSEGITGPSGVIGGYMFSKVPDGNNNAGILGGYMLAEPGVNVGPAKIGGFMLAGDIRLDGPDFIGGFMDARREVQAKIGGYMFGVPNYSESVSARSRTLVAVTSELVPGQKYNMEAQIMFKGIFQQGFKSRLINVNTIDAGFNAEVEVEKFKRPPTVFLKSIEMMAASGEVFPSGQPVPNFYNGARKVCVIASGYLGDGNEFVSAQIDFGDPFDTKGGFKPFLSVSGFTHGPIWSGCHDYTTSGLYVITIRAQDDMGMVGMAASGLNLASGLVPGIHYPSISISGTPRFGEVPPSLQVNFSVMSSGLFNPPFTLAQSNASKVRTPTDERVLWSFGNRERSVRSSPTTFYQSPGLFAPTLRFLYTNPSGGKFMVSDTLMIGFNR